MIELFTGHVLTMPCDDLVTCVSHCSPKASWDTVDCSSFFLTDEQGEFCANPNQKCYNYESHRKVNGIFTSGTKIAIRTLFENVV